MILRYRGRGQAFVLDQGGTDGAFIENLWIKDIVIIAGPGVTDVFHSQGVVRFTAHNIEVRDVGDKVFSIRHGVSCRYDEMKYSPPVGASVFATQIFMSIARHRTLSGGLRIYQRGGGDLPGAGCQLADVTGRPFSGSAFEACGAWFADGGYIRTAGQAWAMAGAIKADTTLALSMTYIVVDWLRGQVGLA